MKRNIISTATFVVAALLVSFAIASAKGPEVGADAPAFTLQDQNGEWHSLSDYEGEWLALYFYPKDDTPGCTTEACNFRDSKFAYEAIGAKVVGVSVDSVESHKEFADKYELPFTLLSDPEGEMCAEYGVLRDYKLMQIADRQSFIIDPEGRIAKHYEDVDPDTHSEEVLADLEWLMQQR